ncbi:hypothetical protein L1987_15199 [Smallanthus sonchifolius]|uniref:Uncharacterized protein n=1 Tax=Smallanthus sonchifolius TaxID=185202 RepID=A0ACB9J4Z0_9ASTR|nr:hypothetical protein L1987_15199 [Smallanthus sonchifolius]
MLSGTFADVGVPLPIMGIGHAIEIPTAVSVPSSEAKEHSDTNRRGCTLGFAEVVQMEPQKAEWLSRVVIL